LSEPAEITILLRQWQSGDDSAGRDLWHLAYTTLRQLARGVATGPERAELESAHLVDAAWEKLCRGVDKTIVDRSHFKGIVARAMRQVIIEHARKRKAQKRPDNKARHGLDGVVDALERSAGDLLDLSEALEELEQHDEELANLVEMHFFGGLTYAEMAPLADMSVRSVERKMRTAKGWLHMRLKARGSEAE
jgi:RNA polymerase sigma factor (TIGR02999 family)